MEHTQMQLTWDELWCLIISSSFCLACALMFRGRCLCSSWPHCSWSESPSSYYGAAKNTDSCLCWLPLGWCIGCVRGQSGALVAGRHLPRPGAQEGAEGRGARAGRAEIGSQDQSHCPCQGAGQAGGSPESVREVHGHEADLKASWAAILQGRVRMSLSQVTRVKHSPMIMRQVHGDGTGPRSRWDISPGVRIDEVHGQAGALLQLKAEPKHGLRSRGRGCGGRPSAAGQGCYAPNAKGSWTEQPSGCRSRKGTLLSPAESRTVLVALFRWAGGRTALEWMDWFASLCLGLSRWKTGWPIKLMNVKRKWHIWIHGEEWFGDLFPVFEKNWSSLCSENQTLWPSFPPLVLQP